MVRRGNQRERGVAQIGRDFGYLVSSRRHEGGPGDQLWVPPDGSWKPVRPLLIEVKGTLDPPWRGKWGPDDRAEMIAAGVQFGLEPLLAWWPPYQGGPTWLPVEDWPA